MRPATDSVLPAQAGRIVRTASTGTPPTVIPAKAGMIVRTALTGTPPSVIPLFRGNPPVAIVAMEAKRTGTCAKTDPVPPYPNTNASLRNPSRSQGRCAGMRSAPGRRPVATRSRTSRPAGSAPRECSTPATSAAAVPSPRFDNCAGAMSASTQERGNCRHGRRIESKLCTFALHTKHEKERPYAPGGTMRPTTECD